MKGLIALLGLLVTLGLVYGLAFFGIIPAQRLADKSPALASVLTKLHLARPKKTKVVLLAQTIDPAKQALDTEKQQVEGEKADLDKERADFIAQKAQATAAPVVPPASSDNSSKIAAIYATMSPDDIARIFTKLPDPDVVNGLVALDEKKAGKVLAALPDDRAARLTRLMSHPTPASLATAAAPSPPPTASL